jgi:hypothetical protein
MAVSYSITPEEFKLFGIGPFILKIFLSTGDGRGDSIPSCDLPAIIRIGDGRNVICDPLPLKRRITKKRRTLACSEE